eukprot:474560-Rhodomonas_salina.3
MLTVLVPWASGSGSQRMELALRVSVMSATDIAAHKSIAPVKHHMHRTMTVTLHRSMIVMLH